MAYYHTLRKVYVTEEEYKKELELYNKGILKTFYIIDETEEQKNIRKLKEENERLKKENEKLEKNNNILLIHTLLK